MQIGRSSARYRPDGADTVVRDTDPHWLASRCGFDEAFTGNLAAIDVLTDIAVAL